MPKLLLNCVTGALGGVWTAAVCNLMGVHAMWVVVPLSCVGGFIFTWSVLRVVDRNEVRRQQLECVITCECDEEK